MSLLCGVCADQPPKYKCPACELRYCSLACFKTHKPAHENPAVPVPTAGSTGSIAKRDDAALTPPPAVQPPSNASPFQQLLTNPALQQLLRTHPALPSQLRRIYSQTLEPPPEELDSTPSGRGNWGRRGGSRGRGGRGRGRGNDRQRGPWKQERADTRAVDQILRVQAYEGGDGEGMREFVALVQKLCGDTEDAGNMDIEAAADA